MERPRRLLEGLDILSAVLKPRATAPKARLGISTGGEKRKQKAGRVCEGKKKGLDDGVACRVASRRPK